MSNQDQFNEQECLLEFEERRYNNDVFFNALELREYDVAKSILKKDGFQLDWNRKIGGQSLFCHLFEKKLDDIVDLLLETQNEEILKEALKKSSIRKHICHSDNPKDVIEKLQNCIEPSDLVISYSFEANEVISKNNPDLIPLFQWEDNTLNTHIDDWYGMCNYAGTAIREKKWELAKALINLDNFNPLSKGSNKDDRKAAFSAYRFSKEMAKHYPEAREIQDLVLKKIEKIAPKKAKQLKSGFFGIGGHKPKI